MFTHLIINFRKRSQHNQILTHYPKSGLSHRHYRT